MKKIASLLMGFVVLATATFAQPKMQAKKSDKAATQTMKSTPKAESAQEAPATPMMKKDGTPDKRFKANKSGKADGPLKQDGTKDMRFKKNKMAMKKAA